MASLMQRRRAVQVEQRVGRVGGGGRSQRRIPLGPQSGFSERWMLRWGLACRGILGGCAQDHSLEGRGKEAGF